MDKVYVFRNKKTGEFSWGNSSHLYCTTKNIVDAQHLSFKGVKRACNSYKNKLNRLIKYYESSIQKLLRKYSNHKPQWALYDKTWHDSLISGLSDTKQKLKDFYNDFEVVPAKLELQDPLTTKEIIKVKEKSKPKKASKEEDIIDGF